MDDNLIASFNRTIDIYQREKNNSECIWDKMFRRRISAEVKVKGYKLYGEVRKIFQQRLRVAKKYENFSKVFFLRFQNYLDDCRKMLNERQMLLLLSNRETRAIKKSATKIIRIGNKNIKNLRILHKILRNREKQLVLKTMRSSFIKRQSSSISKQLKKLRSNKMKIS